MKKIILFIALLFLANICFSQSFTAETGYLYLGANDTEQNGVIKVLSGVLKKNDKIDIYAETGRKFTAIVTKITDNNNQELKEAKPNQDAYFDLKFTENPSTGKDYLRKGYKIYPSGFKPAKDVTDPKPTNEKPNFSTTLDGKPWKANVTYKGAVLWRKGLKNYAYDKPYLQLQFASILPPDERLITIQVFSPKESTAKYTAEDMEVNFSGAIDGKKESTTMYGFVNGKAKPNFVLEITNWQKSGDNKALISGKIYGEIPEILIFGKSKQINRFENGVFENVAVEIINEQHDLKKMLNTGGIKN
jgi:hypothetical protein